jgi:hypothetical protein
MSPRVNYHLSEDSSRAEEHLRVTVNQTIFTQEDPLGNQEQMADRHVRPGILQSVFCYKKKSKRRPELNVNSKLSIYHFHFSRQASRQVPVRVQAFQVLIHVQFVY